MRGEAEGAYPADECRAESHPGPDAWDHAAGQTHKEAATDLVVYAAPSGETNYSVIAKGTKVTRHTVAKWYEMIREILSRYKS